MTLLFGAIMSGQSVFGEVEGDDVIVAILPDPSNPAPPLPVTFANLNLASCPQIGLVASNTCTAALDPDVHCGGIISQPTQSGASCDEDFSPHYIKYALLYYCGPESSCKTSGGNKNYMLGNADGGYITWWQNYQGGSPHSTCKEFSYESGHKMDWIFGGLAYDTSTGCNLGYPVGGWGAGAEFE